MIPNACVVEVIERVPDADVAIVAARVGERLGMPQERVRQLIDGRTGPITRALRPEKADAIAQTFEAAGVRVVIRAADADEIEEARAGGGAAKPVEAPAYDDVAVDPAADRAEPPVDADLEDEPELEPEPALEAEGEIEPGSGSAVQTEPVLDAAPEPDAAPEFEVDPALEFAGEAPMELDPESERELEAAYEADPALAFEPELEPDPAVDEDLVAGPDAPSERALAREVAYIFATGESPAWRGETVDLDAPELGEEDWSDEVEDAPPAAGGPGGVMDVVDVDEDDAAGHEARGEVARAEVARAHDGFPPVGGWDAEGAGAWSTRRGAADADGVVGDAAGRSEVPTFAIGRASRQRRDGSADSSSADASAAESSAAETRTSETPSDREALAIDGSNGRQVSAVAFEDAPMAPAPRPVPTAWRGLGGAEAGPARPLSARLPRRTDGADEPRFTFDEPPVRRRAVMLAALGVAVVLFVFAQWWVASRAGAAGVDPFDAYRRGEFAAARAVWNAEAAAGDASARFMLGYLAEAGLGAPWSARTAAGWYRAAAEVGHAEAMWRLARLYEVGLGVAPDTLEARRWYRSAAQAGHAEAAFAWGRIVLHDAGVALGAGAAPQVAAATAAEAASAFERAAELGWHEAAPYAAAFAALAVEAP
ncbi:MAG: hypothetical protein ABR510_04040 [Trueperaceae bacterium]